VLAQANGSSNEKMDRGFTCDGEDLLLVGSTKVTHWLLENELVNEIDLVQSRSSSARAITCSCRTAPASVSSCSTLGCSAKINQLEWRGG
jgi:hypothetical protein